MKRKHSLLMVAALMMMVALVATLATAGGAWANACPENPISEGSDAAAVLKAEVRYRNLQNPGTGHLWLGTYPITTSGNRVEQNFNNWRTQPNSNDVVFKYIEEDTSKYLRSEVQTNDFYEKNKTVEDLGELNYIQIKLVNTLTTSGPNPDYISLNNLTINGCLVGTGAFAALRADPAPGGTIKTYMIKGFDLSDGFTIEGDLLKRGNTAGDTRYIQISVGYLEPPDDEGPVTSNVQTDPETGLLNGQVTVTANVDDSTKGGSDIKSAEYKLEYRLNEGDPWSLITNWTQMDAQDGAFDEVSEDVTKTFDVTEVGHYKVCVRGTDEHDNVGNTACWEFLVTYVFSGYFSPLENWDSLNKAKAGQAIPVKWRLTDANGVPISDPTSFVNLFSCQVNCSDMDVIGSDDVETYAGGSGLQYMDNGYWQFNWKTPKTYAGLCREMFIKLKGGGTTPNCAFSFK